MRRHLTFLASLAATAACVGNADKGRLAPRLEPVGPESLLARTQEARAAFDVPPSDAPRAGNDMVSLRQGSVRRQARFVDVPVGQAVELVTRVPEGIRELTFALGAPWSPSTTPVGCAVAVRARWSAGDVTDEVTLPLDGSAGWSVVRLAGQASRAPSALRVQWTRTTQCEALPLLGSLSEILPVAPATLDKRPNVVLVTLSGMRRDRFDCGEVSRRVVPRMSQRWCSRGVYFENAYSTGASTSSALASMHTGHWPHAQPRSISPSATTLAEHLQGEGYATFSVVASPQASGGLSRGFDTFVESPPTDEGARAPLSAKTVVDQTLAWLTEQRHEPFFISLVLADARATDTTTSRAHHDAALSAMDKEVDRLIDYLVDARLEARTAFVIVADTGVQLEDEGRGPALDDEILHIPLLVIPPVRGGGSPASLRSNILASGADVFATALSLAGAPVPPSSPSRDLTWAIDGLTGFGRDYVLSESLHEVPERWSVFTPTLHALLTAPNEVQVFDRASGPSAPLPPESPLFQEGQSVLRRAVRETVPSETPSTRAQDSLRAHGYAE